MSALSRPGFVIISTISPNYFIAFMKVITKHVFENLIFLLCFFFVIPCQNHYICPLYMYIYVYIYINYPGLNGLS